MFKNEGIEDDNQGMVSQSSELSVLM